MPPPAGITWIDPANKLLAPVTVDLETGTLELGGTKFAVLTMRTASTTFTVLLDAPGLATWLQVLTGLQGTMGAGIQVISPDQARALGLDGHG